jgi:hypothetical protein
MRSISVPAYLALLSNQPAIAPALADPLLSPECLELNRQHRLNTLHVLAAGILARLYELEAEEKKHFARFDAKTTITLSGIVKEFKFSAPRATIILDVGETQPATWTVEMNSPASLLREGWMSKTLTPGMPITLTIHPLRDGSNGGQFLTATLPDGRLMDGTVTVTIQTRLQSLRDQAAAADRELAEFLQSSGCGR